MEIAAIRAERARTHPSPVKLNVVTKRNTPDDTSHTPNATAMTYSACPVKKSMHTPAAIPMRPKARTQLHAPPMRFSIVVRSSCCSNISLFSFASVLT